MPLIKKPCQRRRNILLTKDILIFGSILRKTVQKQYLPFLTKAEHHYGGKLFFFRFFWLAAFFAYHCHYTGNFFFPKAVSVITNVNSRNSFAVIIFALFAKIMLRKLFCHKINTFAFGRKAFSVPAKDVVFPKTNFAPAGFQRGHRRKKNSVYAVFLLRGNKIFCQKNLPQFQE